MRALTDGSSAKDAKPKVVIDTSNRATVWRYRCPKGHSTIDPTNGGVWCASCASNPDVENPHYHDILDKKTGEEIAWSRVVLR